MGAGCGGCEGSRRAMGDEVRGQAVKWGVRVGSGVAGAMGAPCSSTRAPCFLVCLRDWYGEWVGVVVLGTHTVL